MDINNGSSVLTITLSSPLELNYTTTTLSLDPTMHSLLVSSTCTSFSSLAFALSGESLLVLTLDLADLAEDLELSNPCWTWRRTLELSLELSPTWGTWGTWGTFNQKKRLTWEKNSNSFYQLFFVHVSERPLKVPQVPPFIMCSRFTSQLW